MVQMEPKKLQNLMSKGKVEKFPAGQVFHSLDFKEEMYVVTSGYVKRYAVNAENSRVIESIYGPHYFFPLTPVFAKLWNFTMSKESSTYIYQSMTDVELQSISFDKLSEALGDDPELYADLLYEAGRRLRANINRLASNALQDDYLKISQQLIYLAEEFGNIKDSGLKKSVTIQVPLTATDMAEQLNISVSLAEAIMDRLVTQGLIKRRPDGLVAIPDLDLLKGPITLT